MKLGQLVVQRKKKAKKKAIDKLINKSFQAILNYVFPMTAIIADMDNQGSHGTIYFFL